MTRDLLPPLDPVEIEVAAMFRGEIEVGPYRRGLEEAPDLCHPGEHDPVARTDRDPTESPTPSVADP